MKYEGTLYRKVAGKHIPMTETVLELETKIKKLIKYARHLDDCEVQNFGFAFRDEKDSCTCGFNDTLKRAIKWNIKD